MEFYENRSKRPFVVFVWIGKTICNWYRINRTRRILSQMSDEQLKDVGLSRYDVSIGLPGGATLTGPARSRRPGKA
jgi:uncharacterized protein YjiS (DUF1127 family)